MVVLQQRPPINPQARGSTSSPEDFEVKLKLSVVVEDDGFDIALAGRAAVLIMFYLMKARNDIAPGRWTVLHSSNSFQRRINETKQRSLL